MKTIITLLAIVLSTSIASAANNTCHSVREIKEIFPNDSAKYTHYMKDHRGEKCWYAASVGFEHDRSGSSNHSKAMVKVDRSDVSPPPMVVKTNSPSAIYLMPRSEGEVWQPTYVSPMQRITEVFEFLGFSR